jgi:phosphatidate cytidylyltransferase
MRIDLVLCSAAALLVLPALVLIFRKEGVLERIAGSAGVFFVFGVPLLAAVSCWLLMLPFEPLNIFKSGTVPGMLFLIAVSKTMDTGGYIFGMLSGKFLPGGNHKIAPSVSPKKSWEGFVGGIVVAMLGMVVYCMIVDNLFGYSVNYVIAVIYGLVGSVGSVVGDLTMSVIKRQAGIKDYGKLIPGHGGILDRFDSVIITAPLTEALMILIPMVV